MVKPTLSSLFIAAYNKIWNKLLETCKPHIENSSPKQPTVLFTGKT